MTTSAGIWPFEASAVLLTVLALLSLARRGSLVVTLLFAFSLLLTAAGQIATGILVNDPARFAGAGGVRTAFAIAIVAGMAWPLLSYTLGRPGGGGRLARAVPFFLAWGAVGTAIVSWAWPDGIIAAIRTEGPEGPRLHLGAASPWFLSWMLITLVMVITNFEATLRIATGGVLRRLKLMLVALIAAIAVHVLLLAQALLYRTAPFGHFRVAGWAVLAAAVFMAWCLLRHRVSDLSVPAARPVIYSAITTTVFGAYLLLIAIVDSITRRLGMPASAVWTPSVIAVLAGAAGVAVFAPRFSRWVREFADRNLYAQRFDYRREWARASSRLDPAHPLPELAGSVAELVRSVVGASGVHVLVRGGHDTLDPVARAGEPGDADGLPLDHPVARALRNGDGVLALEGREADLDGIGYLVEGERIWGRKGPSLVVGLLVNRELVGAILVGAKPDGQKYNAEEIDLLATMSHQLAHVLWARRLGDELVETRELESFHRLASFVLHDLKTVVTGLSLSLGNAERRAGDPAAMELTLRSVSSSVERMKHLMERVARARTPGELELEGCDVDALVGDCLAEAMDDGDRARVRVKVRSEGPGRVPLDRTQVLAVLRNLVRNACDAMPEGGDLEIRVGRRAIPSGEPRENGITSELVITVRDTGAGMDPSFIATRLFRPFESTKHHGFGLGLFQSRGIVEAHGGRLEVASVPGEGSEFRVVLPIRPEARSVAA